MNDAYLMGPLADRKRALIKKLSGQNNGAGGASRLSAGVPFGALPRLGFSPNARSVFNRNENFNFRGAPEGFQQAVPNVSAPGGADGGYNWGTRSFGPPSQGAAPAIAPTAGVGPSAGLGSGSPGLPQGVSTFTDGGMGQGYPGISSSGFSGGNDGGSRHLLGVPAPAPPHVPFYVQRAMETGDMSSGVNAWLKQNPWFLDQLGSTGGVGGAGVL